jgi:hypothetical protein
MPMLDEQGCLTSEGIAAVRSAAPGALDADLAAHLSACDRCQSRVLSDGVPRLTRAKPPTYNATLVVFVAIVLAIVTLVLALRILAR